MIETVLVFVGKAAASAVFDAIKTKLLGIEYQQVSIEDWGKTAVLAVFFQQSMRPELSNEKKVELRLNDLQRQIDGVKKDIEDLRDEMAAFKWEVKTALLDAREETLWQEMIDLDADADSFYDQMSDIGKSKATDKRKGERASELAANIISKLRSQVTTRRMLGGVVGANNQRVRGFIEVWGEQALRDADKGWDNNRLAGIYGILESKFTRALLIQLKCVRLLMEAYETQYVAGDSTQDALAYYSNTFYPVLKAEVEGFRDMVESLAVNLLPLPTGSLLPLKVPPEIAGMLAGLDLFTAQALGGNIANANAGAASKLPEAPAVSGTWGRVFIPSSRWIRRAPGSKEEARVKMVTPYAGIRFPFKGKLEVRAVKYTPYTNDKGQELHKGYQIQVGNDMRDMNTMLVAHFTPTEVLRGDFLRDDGKPWKYELALETGDGKDELAQTEALVFPVKVSESEQLKVPYGTFTMSFTGGAGVRAK